MTDSAHEGRGAVPRWPTVVALAATGALLGPTLLGWHYSVVASGSMSPAVEAGDVVVTSPMPPGRAAAGDVIRFDHPHRPGRSMLHRISAVTENGLLVTKGDANRVADSAPVPASAVTGLGRLRVRYAGLPVLWWLDRDYPRLAGTALVLLVLCPLVPRRCGTARRPGRGRRAGNRGVLRSRRSGRRPS